MAALPWVGLLVFLVATGGGIALAAARGLGAWRALRSLRRGVGEGLADATRRLEGIEPRLAHIGETTARLEAARARLQESLATAAVLAAALGEARALAGRVSAFVPR